MSFKDYAYAETRYSMLAAKDPQAAEQLLQRAQEDVQRQWEIYQARAAATLTPKTPSPSSKEGELI